MKYQSTTNQQTGWISMGMFSKLQDVIEEDRREQEALARKEPQAGSIAEGYRQPGSCRQ
jgi:hypothetical protein